MAVATTQNGQPVSPAPADQVMSPAQIRDLFLQTALYSSIPTDPIAWTPGQTLSVKVPQTGVACKIRLLVSLTLTVGTAALALGPRGVYQLLSSIQYTDPSGTVRVNSNGYSLYLLSISDEPWDYDPSSGNAGAWTTSATVANQVYATGTGGTGAQTVNFFVDIPISKSQMDTRGSMVLESATSPSFISVTMPTLAGMVSTAANTEFAYTSATGTVTAVAGTIQPVYYFWKPTYVDTGSSKLLPLPVQDFNIVHEIVTIRNSASLNTNTDNRITLPTGRSYYKVVAELVNNGAFGGSAADVTGVKFEIDQSTDTLKEPIQGYYSRVRSRESRDMPLGTFIWDFSKRPFDSSHYGQLDCILTLGSSALVSPYIQATRDCLYQSPQV